MPPQRMPHTRARTCISSGELTSAGVRRATLLSPKDALLSERRDMRFVGGATAAPKEALLLLSSDAARASAVGASAVGAGLLGGGGPSGLTSPTACRRVTQGVTRRRRCVAAGGTHDSAGRAARLARPPRDWIALLLAQRGGHVAHEPPLTLGEHATASHRIRRGIASHTPCQTAVDTLACYGLCNAW